MCRLCVCVCVSASVHVCLRSVCWGGRGLKEAGFGRAGLLEGGLWPESLGGEVPGDHPSGAGCDESGSGGGL